jgi:hypothetical protein
MMPQQIDAAIREMCSDAMSQAVAALAEKYSFDAEEANRFLATDTLKIVRKRGPAASPKTEKPKTSPRGGKADKADKPKRGKTGYLLYADEVRSEVKDELTAELEDGVKLKPQDVVKTIAARWKAEDQEVRDEWNAKAKTPVTSDEEPNSSATSEDEAEVAIVVEPEMAKPKPKNEKKGKKSLENEE